MINAGKEMKNNSNSEEMISAGIEGHIFMATLRRNFGGV